MERPRLARWVGAAGVVVAAGIGMWLARPTAGRAVPGGIPGDDIPLEVEVLNATRIDGLARRITRHLRHRGIDVVFYGTARPDTVTATTLLVRRGDSSLAAPVLEALGFGVVRLAPDEDALLDVTVLLGPDAAALGGRP